MLIVEFNEEIEDEEAMSEFLSEQLENFCDHIESEEGMTRPVDEYDCSEAQERAAFMWTDKGMKTIERERGRLQDIATQYFPNSDVAIETDRCREY